MRGGSRRKRVPVRPAVGPPRPLPAARKLSWSARATGGPRQHLWMRAAQVRHHGLEAWIRRRIIIFLIASRPMLVADHSLAAPVPKRTKTVALRNDSHSWGIDA